MGTNGRAWVSWAGSRLLLVALFGFCGLGWPSGQEKEGPSAPPAVGPLRVSPCEMEAVEGKALCGTFQVFENRKARAGRRLDIHFTILKALDEEPAPDPLFVMGGAAQGPTQWADYFAQKYAKVRQKRDLVMVDQRGAGKSNPLNCDFLGPADSLKTHVTEMLNPAYVKACRKALERRADLSLYTNAIAMDDLDDSGECFRSHFSAHPLGGIVHFRSVFPKK